MAHPPRRRLAPEDAELLYDQYVSALRQGVMQPADRAEDWQTLADGMWEHANWLDVVDGDLRVLSLVDRWKLLDRALKRVTRPTAMGR
jgi:hypothetical protein